MTSKCDFSYEPDGPTADVYKAEWRVAGRSHKCVECGHAIRPGDRYEYVSGCWEGRWAHFQTCELCAKIRRELCTSGCDHGWLDFLIDAAVNSKLELLHKIFRQRETIASLVELVEELMEVAG